MLDKSSFLMIQSLAFKVEFFVDIAKDWVREALKMAKGSLSRNKTDGARQFFLYRPLPLYLSPSVER